MKNNFLKTLLVSTSFVAVATFTGTASATTHKHAHHSAHQVRSLIHGTTATVTNTGLATDATSDADKIKDAKLLQALGFKASGSTTADGATVAGTPNEIPVAVTDMSADFTGTAGIKVWKADGSAAVDMNSSAFTHLHAVINAAQADMSDINNVKKLYNIIKAAADLAGNTKTTPVDLKPLVDGVLTALGVTTAPAAPADLLVGSSGTHTLSGGHGHGGVSVSVGGHTLAALTGSMDSLTATALIGTLGTGVASANPDGTISVAPIKVNADGSVSFDTSVTDPSKKIKLSLTKAQADSLIKGLNTITTAKADLRTASSKIDTALGTSGTSEVIAQVEMLELTIKNHIFTDPTADEGEKAEVKRLLAELQIAKSELQKAKAEITKATTRALPPRMSRVTAHGSLADAIRDAKQALDLAKTALIAYTSSMTGYAKAKTLVADLTRAIGGAGVIPEFGKSYSQFLRDSSFGAQALFERRGLALQGAWFKGSFPVSEGDLDSANKGAKVSYGSKNIAVAFGFDKMISNKESVGGFMTYAKNSGNSKGKIFEQDKSSINFGVYGTYQIQPKMYVSDKVSYNTSSFDNKSRKYDGLFKYSLDLKGFNNEVAVGFILNNQTIAEAYLNTIFTQSTDSKVSNKNDNMAAKAMNTTVDIDSQFYNAIGLRGFFKSDKSVVANMDVKPFARGFVEVNATGKDLDGKFTQAGRTHKGTFDSLGSVAYGLSIGATISPLANKNLTATVSYALNGYENTSHSIDCLFNLSL